MELVLLLTGKTSKNYISEAEKEFSSRIKRYNRFSMHSIEISKKFKSSTPALVKKEEAKVIMQYLKSTDYLVLLDENGQAFKSRPFAEWLQKQLVNSHKRIVFIVGGAFGFDQDIHDRANFKLSLSSMTFSHQLIRAIFMEQLYRAFTILKNEKYHND